MACSGPSLSGAFDILGAAGHDKLLYLKHKLKTLRPGCRGAYLLHAMVLLKLGQETEARISLEALKADAVAQLVARQWFGVDSTEAPEEPPDVSWAVARVYHLLAEEKLCPAPMREEAYRAALCAFSSRDDLQLGELQEEARNRCGWDVLGDLGGVQTLRSDLGCLPPSSASPSQTCSDPRPIEHLSGWSRACSLRSTGSPASLASNLEISQSPTMALLSRHHSSYRASKLCDHPQASVVPEPAPLGCQEPEEMSWPSSVEAAGSPLRPSSPGLGLPEVTTDACPASPHDPPEVPEVSAHYPVECTDVPAAPKSLPSPSENACLDTDQTPVHLSVEDTAYLSAQPRPPTPSVPQTSPSFHSPSTSPFPSPSTPPKAHPTPPKTHPTPPKAHPTVWNPEPPPPELESSEQKFYNFVVLHASADEHIALRVRERLEALGVSDGATFCEDFQVPGRGELHCLQDALDHSAFIILLLTSNFDCRLSQHQTNQSLMSSLTRHGWQDCVIPFLPRESSLAQLSPSTSSLLTGLVWLDEHSKIFARKVTNTFKPQTLRARKAKWRKEQDARALREQSQQLESERQHAAAWGVAYSAYVHSYLAYQTQMEKLQVALANYMPFGTQLPFGGQGSLGTPPSPFPTLPGHQPPPLPPWLGGTPPPIFPQPPLTLPQPPLTFPQPPPAFQQPPPAFPQPSPAFPQPPPDFPQAPPAHPQSPGLQPLIIHHAQMVQLGVNNHMWNQRGTQAPEDKSRETE
uniref:TIR domain-containing adapter molecule 1 n=1 Tax=Moschus moschiferus TaxID=68415 RepID=A0A8C6FW01_MOSMO